MNMLMKAFLKNKSPLEYFMGKVLDEFDYV